MEYSADLKCPELPRAGQPQVGRISWRMLLLGAAISIGLLFFLLRKLDWNQFWAALARIDGRVLALPMVATLCCFFLRPWRWQRMFPIRMKVDFWICFGAFGIGAMANNFLPARGGDLLRCYLVARKNPLTRSSTALATLGLEKILDGLALLAVLLVSSLFLTPPRWPGHLRLVSGFVFGGALGVAFLLHHRMNWFLVATHLVFRVLHLKPLADKPSALLEWFAQGLGAMSSLPQMTKLITLTALIWIVDAVAVLGLGLGAAHSHFDSRGSVGISNSGIEYDDPGRSRLHRYV
jgi:uncharacterized membrane protein YbhN (UPF0104 family)